MVTSGTHVNAGCCFGYGNAETNNLDTGNGHMEAIYVGKLCWFPPCSGAGPWVLEGPIILGVGGDNSNVSAGTFFEGAMTAGFPPEATEDAVQANIVAAGYGK